MHDVTHYVVGFMCDNTCKNVVMIQKNKPEWQRGTWNGVGGKVEDSESTHDAMVREFLEETGVNTSLTPWTLCVILDGSKRGYHVSFYRVLVKELPPLAQMTDERVATLPIRDVMNGVFPCVDNMRWILPLCLDFSVETPVEISANV